MSDSIDAAAAAAPAALHLARVAHQRDGRGDDERVHAADRRRQSAPADVGRDARDDAAERAERGAESDERGDGGEDRRRDGRDDGGRDFEDGDERDGDVEERQADGHDRAEALRERRQRPLRQLPEPRQRLRANRLHQFERGRQEPLADLRDDVRDLRLEDPLLVREAVGRASEVAGRVRRLVDDERPPRLDLRALRDLPVGVGEAERQRLRLDLRGVERHAERAQRLDLADETGPQLQQHLVGVHVVERREVRRERDDLRRQGRRRVPRHAERREQVAERAGRLQRRLLAQADRRRRLRERADALGGGVAKDGLALADRLVQVAGGVDGRDDPLHEARAEVRGGERDDRLADPLEPVIEPADVGRGPVDGAADLVDAPGYAGDTGAALPDPGDRRLQSADLLEGGGDVEVKRLTDPGHQRLPVHVTAGNRRDSSLGRW